MLGGGGAGGEDPGPGSPGPEAWSVGDCDAVAESSTLTGDRFFTSLSRVHAQRRFFGDHQDPSAVDQALVQALRSVDPEVDADAFITAYVSATPGSCARMGAEDRTGLAHVEMIEDVAWVRFGGGEFTIPNEATAVVVDLVGSVEGLVLDQFLARVAMQTLDGELTPLRAKLRVHEGMRDEVYAPLLLGSEGLYDDRIETLPLATWTGDATSAKQLAIRVPQRLPPSAARFALALRAAGRAAIFGAPIMAKTAELSAAQLSDRVVYQRTMTVLGEDGPLPDRIEPDVAASEEAGLTDLEERSRLAAALLELGALSPLAGEVSRDDLLEFPNESVLPDDDADLAARVAALVIAHGAARQFFPYWSVVEDDFDPRLEQVVALAGSEDNSSEALAREIGQLAHGLHDSHGFILQFPSEPRARLALFLEKSSTGEPVVRLSSDAFFAPGDTLVELDGVPVAVAMQLRGERIASSASSRFRNEADALLELEEPAELIVRSAAGELRNVMVDPEFSTLGYPLFPARSHGFLSDLGADTTYYVNISGQVLSEADLPAIEADLATASRLVLDVRGYPGAAAWEFVPSLLVDGSSGVPMTLASSTVLGTSVEPLPQSWPANPGGFAGPVVVLVSPHTQSAAEHLVLTLQAAGRVTVVGNPSAGANGNITGVLLPGAFGLTFTGLEVLQPDGSTFHGVGVLPDLTVPIAPSALANGADPELEMALAFTAL